jgi:hypothetical protein
MLEGLFKASDLDGNGIVDLSEFLSMVGHLKLGLSTEEVRLPDERVNEHSHDGPLTVLVTYHQ